MANLLETIRNGIMTSVYGRRLGLTQAEFLAGPKDLQLAVEDLTTVATTVIGYGLSRVITSGSSQGPTQHFLPAPIPGVKKILSISSTSTGSAQFLSTANGASILAASDSTTKGVVNLLGQGGSVTLIGLTTAIWQVIGFTSTGSVTYTSST